MDAAVYRVGRRPSRHPAGLDHAWALQGGVDRQEYLVEAFADLRAGDHRPEPAHRQPRGPDRRSRQGDLTEKVLSPVGVHTDPLSFGARQTAAGSVAGSVAESVAGSVAGS